MTFINRRQVMKLTGGLVAGALFAPHIARAAATKIRLGHNNSPTSIFHMGALAFQKHIAEKSDGRYEVEIFPSAQLGSDVQVNKACSEGTVDASTTGLGALSSFNPNVSLPELPYLFKDVPSARAAYDGKVGAYITESTKDTGLAIIGYGESGFRHVTANKPVRTPDDLKGLKIRVQPAPIHVESFIGFGAAAEPLVFTELQEAIRTGRFEAQENPISIAVSNDWIPKLQSHFNLTGHVYSPAIILFSQDILDEMSEEDQAVIRAGGVAAAQATRAVADELLVSGLTTLKAAGMTIVEDVDKAAFQEKMLGMNDRLAKVVDLAELEKLRSLVG